LAIVKDGDEIELDVSEKRLELLLPEAEIKARLALWTPPAPHYSRGYGKMYLEHILQAHQGCDFDFLVGRDPGDDISPLRRFPNPAL
jgi:dihydroxy-acid dehydratase